MIYLDNAATTKPCDKAINAAVDIAKNAYGNASSLHSFGITSEKIVSQAEQTILKKLNLKGDVIFTGSATESNNTALFGIAKTLARQGKKIITTTVEHPSVARAMDKLESDGYSIVRLNPYDYAVGEFEHAIASQVDEKTILVSVMAVNNEIGFITDTKKLHALIKRANPKTIFHTDGVQGFLKVPLSADLISISGHKLHTFKGIGALFVAKGVRLEQLLYGGNQQKNLRSGTIPTELIGSFNAAIEAYPIDDSHIKALNTHLQNRLSELNGIAINSINAVPHIINFSVEGILSEILLHFLEQQDIYISSGSACAKGRKSKTLLGFGISQKVVENAVRVSFCHENTLDDIDSLVEQIKLAQIRFDKRKYKR